MILAVNDKRRQDYLKDGKVLWNLRNNGGGGKGLMAGGIVLLIFGVLLFALFAVMGRGGGGLLFGGFFGIPGLILFLWGFLGQKKKMKNYLAYYQEETGFSLEELGLMEQEILSPDMVMIGNVPAENRNGASEKHPQIACMMTEHYFIMPMLMGKTYIRRYPDMLLAAYSERIPGTGGYKHGLVFLSRKDDSAYINAFLTKEVCKEVISRLREHNPQLITATAFSCNDKEYDVITNAKAVIDLFQGM